MVFGASVTCKPKPSFETPSRRNALAVLCGLDLGGFHCSLKPHYLIILIKLEEAAKQVRILVCKPA